MARRLISFDSTGTLLHVSKSVGYHYTRVLTSFFPGALSKGDIALVTSEFDKSFAVHYRASCAVHPNFGAGGIGAYAWWSDVVKDTFLSSGIDIKSYQFSYVFDEIYRDFRTAKCWDVYPETLDVLRALKSADMGVVVVSDFDEGLGNILEEHGIAVEAVVTSYSHGLTKPDLLSAVRQEFPGIGWHVGDSVKRDVEGARKAGIVPVFLDRSCGGAVGATLPENVLTIHSLSDVIKLLGIC